MAQQDAARAATEGKFIALGCILKKMKENVNKLITLNVKKVRLGLERTFANEIRGK